MRSSLSLDGPWQFGVSTDPDVAAVQFDRTIDVPAYPQRVFDDLPQVPAYYWYRRQVSLPDVPPEHVAAVEFGAVDFLADVWADDRLITTHRGGHLPFRAELTPDGRGEVTLTVRAWDAPVDARSQDADRPHPRWIPRGKQGWYGECSGIWQPTVLEVAPRHRLTGIRTEALESSAGASIEVWHTAPSRAEATVEISPAGSDRVVWRDSVAVAAGEPVTLIASDIGLSLWSPDTPSLYAVRVQLRTGDLADMQTFVTGFRRVRAQPDGLWLNDAPLYLRGALDQDYTPSHGYAYPGDEAVEGRMHAAKRAGLNLLRCHVKIPDPRYLAVADRVGLLIWYELPSWGHPVRPDEPLPGWLDEHVESALRDAARRDGHHPALIARSLVNEGWGLDLPGSADDRARLRRWTAVARELDPTRLVIDNSAMRGRGHVDTDLADFHTYGGHPHSDAVFAGTVARLAERPPEIWSREDAAPPGDRPVALTEFGIWGLPASDPAAGRGLYDRRRDARATPALVAADVAARFEASAARTAFATRDALTAATRDLQAGGLRRQISRIRATAGLAGFVLTEMMDQTWEANGLLEFDGTPKPALDALADVAAADALILDGFPTCCWSGDELAGRAIMAGPAAGPGRLTLTVASEPRGAEDVVIPGGPEPREFAAPRLTAPVVATPTRIDIHARLDLDGASLEQQIRTLVVPTDLQTIEGKLRVLVTGVSETDQTGSLANALAEAGCTVLTEPTRVAAVVSVGGDRAGLDAIAGGLPGLILAEAHDTGFLPSIPRKGRFAPHWVTGFDWVRPGFLDRWGDRPLLDLPYVACAARRVIPALDGLDRADVLMGTFRGWIGDEAAITAQACYGAGRAVMTTLRLAESGRADPVARALLVSLLTYAVSDACAPTTRIR